MKFILYHGTRATPASIRQHGLVAGGLDNLGDNRVNKIKTLQRVLDEFGLDVSDVPVDIYMGELEYEANRPVHVHLETSFENAVGYADMGGEPAFIFRRGILEWWAGMLLGDTETVLHILDREMHFAIRDFAKQSNGHKSFLVVVEIDTEDPLLDRASADMLMRLHEAQKRFPDALKGPCEIRYNGTIAPDKIVGIIQVQHNGL